MIHPPLHILFMEGDPGDRMFIIRKGKVRIMKREGSQMTTLAELGPGAILGEMSLLDNQPRSATAKTLETTEVVEIDQKMLEQTFSQLPTWLTTIVRMVVQRLRETTARKYKDDVVHSLAASLFLINTKAQLEENNSLALSPLAEKMRGLYGLSTNDFIKVLHHFQKLGLIQLTEEVILVLDPLLIHDLYNTLADQSLPKPERALEITEKQLLLLESMVLAKPLESTLTQGKFLKVSYPSVPDAGPDWVELTRSDKVRWVPTLLDGEVPNQNHVLLYEPEKIRRLVQLNKILPKLTTGII